MKKLFLFGLVVLLLICIAPVAGLTAVDDYYYINLFAYAGNDVIADILVNDFPITTSLSIEITQSPIHGSAFVNSDGLLVYRPYSWGYQGLDSLKYRLYDGNEYSNEATVEYNLKGASVARDDMYNGVINCPYGCSIFSPIFSGDSPNILSNDLRIGDPLQITIQITEQPKSGFVQCSNTGKTCYYFGNQHGDPPFFGIVYFKYRIYDGQWYSNNATVALDIVPWVETPSQVNYFTPVDTKLVVDDLGDFWMGWDLSFFDVNSGPSHGILSLKTCGDSWNNECFDYIPNAGYRGKDSFIVRPYYGTMLCGDVPSRETTVTIYVGDPPYPIPGYTNPPTDPDGDGIYEDLNANSRLDFADVVLYFNQMTWIDANEPIAAFDLNGNDRIDFADIVALFNKI